MPTDLPEPWLRGPLPGIDPMIAAVLFSFQQALEDLTKYTDGLTPRQMWERPHGLASAGSQIRHIAGSVDRLLTYAEGRQLSDSQLAELRSEAEGTESREELLAALRSRLEQAEARVRALDLRCLRETRGVGRKRLPTTLIGLLIHTAEHTQRHVGQAIVTAKIVRAMEK